MKDIRRIARKPFRPLDLEALKAACLKLIENKSQAKLEQLLARRKNKSIWTLKDVVEKCGRKVKLVLYLDMYLTEIFLRMIPDPRG